MEVILQNNPTQFELKWLLDYKLLKNEVFEYINNNNYNNDIWIEIIKINYDLYFYDAFEELKKKNPTNDELLIIISNLSDSYIGYMETVLIYLIQKNNNELTKDDINELEEYLQIDIVDDIRYEYECINGDFLEFKRKHKNKKYE